MKETRPTPVPPLAPQGSWRQRAFWLALLLTVALFHFLTMPRFTYPGDNLAIQAEAAHWLATGRVGFDYREKDQIAELNTYRGQYFYANDAKQTLFSKYGFLYSLQYLPPLWLKNQLTFAGGIFDDSPQWMLINNSYHILWAIFYMAYLYKIFTLYNRSRGQALLLVFLAIYPSYVWYYLRSPDKEIFQMVSFTGAVYHLLAYLRSCREGSPAWKHLAAALFWGGYTYLFKPLYALLVMAISFFTGRELYLGRRQGYGAGPLTRRSWFPSLLTLGGMLTLILTLSLVHNYLRTGSIFVAGYGQDSHDPVMFVFTAAHFFQGLATYFLWPGNGNWFLHHPLLLLALGGYAAFFRQYRSEALFTATLALLHLLVYCFHIEWIGEWCYGPRFSLHLIMLATIPAALAMGKFFAAVKEKGWSWGRRGAVLLALALTLISLRAQIYVHTWHYFTYFYYSAALAPLHDAGIDRYFQTMPHWAWLNRDLTRYRNQRQEFSLLATVRQSPLPDPVKFELFAQTGELIATKYWNYLLFSEPE